MISAKMESEKIDQLFAELIEKSIDLRPALVAIEQEMMDAVEQTFEDEGRPKWQKLSDVTLAHREKIGKSGKILQVKGQLAASIQGRNHPNHIGGVTKDSVIIGTNLEYATYQQEGTEQQVTPKQQIWLAANLNMHRKVGDTIKMEARPFLEIYPETVRAAEDILADHLIGKL